ncbi:MAG: hypothetical protein JW772_01460 [Candidatus Diapherotrites archaeon]|nr:hypothetical protein [Candidatus Diapherotrites archaeon]
MAKENFSIKREMVWSGWCPIHNGAPPAFDAGGYHCSDCGKTVCAACIYKTNLGVLCANCVKREKKDITEVKPVYIKGVYQDRYRVNYVRWGFLASLVIFPIFAVIGIGILLTNNDPIFEQFGTITMIGITAFFSLVSLYLYWKNYREKTKPLGIELDKQKVKELEEKMAGQ